MIKKLISITLALAMVFSMLFSTTALAAVGADSSDPTAETVSKTYLDSGKVFNGTAATRENLDDAVDFVKDQATMTWSLEFNTKQTGFQSLLCLNGLAGVNNYINIYMSKTTLGMEIRNEQSTLVNNANVIGMQDGNWHNLKLEVVDKIGYKLDLNQNKITEVNS